MARETPPDPVELADEQVAVSKREVERGRVVVRTRVEERDEVAEIELQQPVRLRSERADVERLEGRLPHDPAKEEPRP
ncbi:MAG: hypothetical protein ACJ8H8_24075 [Geminicoccaceae bacterium]